MLNVFDPKFIGWILILFMTIIPYAIEQIELTVSNKIKT